MRNTVEKILCIIFQGLMAVLLYLGSDVTVVKIICVMMAAAGCIIILIKEKSGRYGNIFKSEQKSS